MRRILYNKKYNNSQWKYELMPINISYFLLSHCCKHTTNRCLPSGNSSFIVVSLIHLLKNVSLSSVKFGLASGIFVFFRCYYCFISKYTFNTKAFYSLCFNIFVPNFFTINFIDTKPATFR